MENKYKVGDKVLVLGTVKSVDDSIRTNYSVDLPNVCSTYRSLKENEILGRLSDFQLEQKKIALTENEKDELNVVLAKLHEKSDDVEDIQDMLDWIYNYEEDFPALNLYLYGNPACGGLSNGNIKNQINLIKAIEDPELIVIEPPTYIIPLGLTTTSGAKQYLTYKDGNCFASRYNKRLKQKFNDKELESIKHGVLVAAIDVDKLKVRVRM